MFYVVNEFLVVVVMLDGCSMMPSFHDGDWIVAEKLSIRAFNDVAVGDVVISRSKKDPPSFVCKRVAAVSGELLPQPHEGGPGSFEGYDSVPRGHVWLEGDNQADSVDSWFYGAVPFNLLRSRVIFRIWPPRRFGWLSNRWFFEPGDMNYF